jgi:hypothetical protein
MIISRTLLCWLLVSISWGLYAHPGDENSPTNDFECDKAGSGMVQSLPLDLARIGRLMCLGNGQLIMANPDWSWRYSGSFFDTPRIPAGAHDDLMGIPPPYFFTKIETVQYSDADAQSLSAVLAGKVVTYTPQVEINKLLEFRLHGNHETIANLMVAFESESKGWILVCAPDCRPEYVILFEERERH